MYPDGVVKAVTPSCWIPKGWLGLEEGGCQEGWTEGAVGMEGGISSKRQGQRSEQDQAIKGNVLGLRIWTLSWLR